MTLFDELQARGLVHNFTDQPGMFDALRKGGMSVYCGFDPTADSLHVGNLVPITGLMRFQRAGHRPIVLVGGGTGMIGDPSGKSKERNLLDHKILGKNIEGIRNQLERYLDFQGPNSAKLVNNVDWLKNLRLIEFLRDTGKHFTVGYMMAKDSVKSRMADTGISYTEFSYMALQAFDFLHLFDTEECALQIGGSDQWGNITAGVELIRRTRGKPAYAITFPLITMSDGRKFGKTEEGNVWLDVRRTSSYRFYQYWIQTDDKDVGRFLRFFTFLSLKEIQEIEKEHLKKPELREGQRRLAFEMTSLIHGEKEAGSAGNASQILFGGKIEGMQESDLLEAAAEMPKTERTGDLPVSTVDALAETGLCKSKGMARKDIKGGGIYVNNLRIINEDASISREDLLFGQYVLLRKGKKTYHLLRFRR